MKKIFFLPLLLFIAFPVSAGVSFHGYDDCEELVSDHIRVVVTPSGAGRLLNFSLEGKNVIVNAAEHRNYRFREQNEYPNLSGGTFLVGPEANVAEQHNIAVREWRLKERRKNSVILETIPNSTDLFRAERTYALAGNVLTVRQTVTNVSKTDQKGSFWGRIWALPGGYHAVPRNPHSRFHLGVLPRVGTLMGHRFPELNWNNILLTDRYVIVCGNPGIPKLDFDPMEGVIFYRMKNGLQLTIRFPVTPGRICGEPSSATVCLYYSGKFSELEPLGPLEVFHPGESKTYAITLKLEKRNFPKKTELKHITFE